MTQRHLRIFLGNFDHHIAPQLRRLQYIHFIDRTQTLATLHRRLKTDMGNAANFRFAIRHGVDADALAVLVFVNATRCAEINIAGQFADDHQIQSCDDFRL